MSCDARLLKIAEMIRIGDRVADIGTDHAYLPIYLIKNKISRNVYACDVSDGPLKNAKDNIEKTHTLNIELRKGDGIAAVKPDEVDTIVIAGMGGDLIIKIISSSAWIRNDKYELILQPMTSVEDLRRYLLNNGFSVVEEKAVRSQGRIYSVIKAQFCGVNKSCSPLFYYIGKLGESIGEEEREYIMRKRRILATLCEDIKNVSTKKEKYEGIVSVISEIDALLRK
jgi:tRNA (adenine22-N1)-methyltransferase